METAASQNPQPGYPGWGFFSYEGDGLPFEQWHIAALRGEEPPYGLTFGLNIRVTAKGGDKGVFVLGASNNLLVLDELHARFAYKIRGFDGQGAWLGFEDAFDPKRDLRQEIRALR